MLNKFILIGSFKNYTFLSQRLPFISLTSITRKIPVRWRVRMQSIYFYLGEIYDRITGRYQDLIPPRRMIFVGRGNFIAIGNHFLQIFINQAQLKNNARILDVGCGIGRIAIPLTQYIDDSGSYEGFDIARPGIKWCQKNITKKFPNFRFQFTDIHNQAYNPDGRMEVKSFRFPYLENNFDFVFLTSVFTHMLPEEIAHYFTEITRVLKYEGTCLMTFFLLNEKATHAMQEGRSDLNFSFQFDGYLSTNKDEPEKAICLEEDFIRNLCAKNRLHIEHIYFGSWCGHSDGLSYQDIIIVKNQNG